MQRSSIPFKKTQRDCTKLSAAKLKKTTSDESDDLSIFGIACMNETLYIKVLDTYARPKHTTQLEKTQSSRYLESFFPNKLNNFSSLASLDAMGATGSNLHFRDSITETAGCISDLFSTLVGLVVGGGTVDVE